MFEAKLWRFTGAGSGAAKASSCAAFWPNIIREIVGMDVSGRVLDPRNRDEAAGCAEAARAHSLEHVPDVRDPRLAGFDAASVVEVIEHLDQPRLRAFERVLFESARPATVALTTPNAEYNVKWPSLPAGQFRHQDHRFEWTRAEFQNWANDWPPGSGTADIPTRRR